MRRGQRLRIRLLLQRRRAGKKRVNVYYRVPRSARAGRHVLKLTGAVPRSPEVGFQERLEIALTPRAPGDGAGPRSLTALVEKVASLRKSRDGLRATIAGSGRGPLGPVGLEAAGPRQAAAAAGRAPLRERFTRGAGSLTPGAA